jgi:YafQ family addiction module toxin component
MYSLDIKPLLRKKLRKIFKRNRLQHEIIFKKVAEILQNPQHYKNLRAPMQFLKRVHIDSSFVLTFSVDESTKTITLEDYDHHDNIYQK